MDRYWRELDRQRLLHAAEGTAAGIGCPLGTPPSCSGEAPRLVRAWEKYGAYPWRTAWASRRPAVEVVHVLDHSYAHLLQRACRDVGCTGLSPCTTWRRCVIPPG